VCLPRQCGSSKPQWLFTVIRIESQEHVQKPLCYPPDQRSLGPRIPESESARSTSHEKAMGIPLYISRYVQWHNHLDVIEMRCENTLKVIHFPTLSYFVTAQDSGHPVQITPSSSHVRTKSDADTLMAPRVVRITFCLVKVNLPVYSVPTQVTPAGPSRGATILLSIQPVTSKDSKREPRL
jgi:hypothetical protein